MNGIVLYGSFHGTTEYFAQLISNTLGLQCENVHNFNIQDIDLYDFFIIGSAIQKFKFHPAVNNFFNNNADALKNKKIFLFISCYNPLILNDIFSQLNSEIQTSIKISMVLGGKINWKKLGFVEKLLVYGISLIHKVKLKNFDSINLKRVDKFIDKIKKNL